MARGRGPGGRARTIKSIRQRSRDVVRLSITQPAKLIASMAHKSLWETLDTGVRDFWVSAERTRPESYSPHRWRFHYDVTPFSSWRWPVLAATCYLLLLYLGPKIMRQRRPFNVKVLLTLHNSFLTVVSIALLVGTTMSVIKEMASQGLEHTYCSNRTGDVQWWVYVFYLSKFYELLDTLFIVLRKKPVTFLHAFHHCIVMPLFWIYLFAGFAPTWIQVILNSTIHVVMYLYMLGTLWGQEFWWKHLLTQAQILQFVLDMVTTLPVMFVASCKSQVDAYPGAYWMLVFGYGVGFAFTLMWLRFYKRTYRKKQPSHKIQ